MWPSIIALVVLIVFLALLGIVFIWDIFALIINGIIIYVIGLRTFAEIRKHHKRLNVYVVTGVISLAVIMFWRNFLPLWKFTTFLILAFVLAQAYFFVQMAQKK